MRGTLRYFLGGLSVRLLTLPLLASRQALLLLLRFMPSLRLGWQVFPFSLLPLFMSRWFLRLLIWQLRHRDLVPLRPQLPGLVLAPHLLLIQLQLRSLVTLEGLSARNF